MKEHTRKKQW